MLGRWQLVFAGVLIFFCRCHCAGAASLFGGLESVFAQLLPVRSASEPAGSQQLRLLLFWPCNSSAECALHGEAKLCFEDMARRQLLNGSLVPLKPIQTVAGRGFWFIDYHLPAEYARCSRAYKPILEFPPSPSPPVGGGSSSWKLNPKCGGNLHKPKCSIRIPALRNPSTGRGAGMCANGNIDGTCQLDGSLPGDVYSFLRPPFTSSPQPAPSPMGLLASVLGVILLVTLLLGILLAWAGFTGRLGPGGPKRPPQSFVRDELRFVDPETGADLFLVDHCGARAGTRQ